MPLLDESCLQGIISSLKSNTHIPAPHLTMPCGKGPPREEGGNDTWEESFTHDYRLKSISKDEFVFGMESKNKENECLENDKHGVQYPKTESFMRRSPKSK